VGAGASPNAAPGARNASASALLSQQQRDGFLAQMQAAIASIAEQVAIQGRQADDRHAELEAKFASLGNARMAESLASSDLSSTAAYMPEQDVSSGGP